MTYLGYTIYEFIIGRSRMDRQTMINYTIIALIVISAFIAGIITGLIAMILAIPLIFFMYLGMKVLGRKMGSFISNIALNELTMLNKLGNKTLLLSEKFNRRIQKEKGALRIFTKIFILNFIAILLITKFLSPVVISDSIKGALSAFLLAIIVSVFISFIISPLSVGLYVLDNSPIRLFNTKEGLIEKPGKMIRMVFRGIFGYGNLIVLIYLLLDSITAAQTAQQGIVIFTFLILLVYGSLALSALIVALIISFKDSDLVNSVLDELHIRAADKATTFDEAVESFKALFEVKEHEEHGEVLSEDR